MEQLLRKLGINPSQTTEVILEELGRKQMEYLERLDSVEDEKRKGQLETELREIEGVISALSWTVKRTETGIRRDKEETEAERESFEDLKYQSELERVETLKSGKTEEELYDEALAVMATPDYARGVEMMRKLADKGYHWAQRQMGKLYCEGNRVPMDKKIGAEWYRKAAEQGNAEAQLCLGARYQYGDGVEQNDYLAVEWYQKAANQGNANAQFHLGWMYVEGRGVAQNDHLAVEWYQKAANQGQAVAIRALKRKGIKI